MVNTSHGIIDYRNQRRSGIVMHISSLPSPYGIGDLGPGAYSFIDLLAESGQTLWQVLPLGPTGFESSPFQSFSIYAGNILFISFDSLIQDGLINENIVKSKTFPVNKVLYDRVIPYKREILKIALSNFKADFSRYEDEYSQFLRDNNHWVNDYALFMSLKSSQDLLPWFEWSGQYKHRDKEGLDRFSKIHKDQIDLELFAQFIFFQQWARIKEYANSKGILIIGDVPLYVCHDSVETWLEPEKFTVNNQGETTFVAGVPPDTYSTTGQRWGYPLYNWDVLEKDGFSWWIKRLEHNIKLFDIIRLNNFIGYQWYWEIPAIEPTAIYGQWKQAPGSRLFDKLTRHFGLIPFLVDNLGDQSNQAESLRRQNDFPQMSVFQFGITSPISEDSLHLPHNYHAHTVAYTSTHDLDPINGWLKGLNEQTRLSLHNYLNSDEESVRTDVLTKLWNSDANFVLVPFQDILGIGKKGRMNHPGRLTGNWKWKVENIELNHPQISFLLNLTKNSNRIH